MVKKMFSQLRNALPLHHIAESHIVSCGTAFIARCNTAPFVPQLLFMLLYRASLDVVYARLLSPLFAYSGFVWNLNLLMLLLSYLMVAASAPFIVELQNCPLPSAKLVTFLHYLYFIPMSSYYALAAPNVTLLPITAVYWALLLLWEFKLPVLSFNYLRAKYTRLIFTLLSLFSVVVVLYISGRYTGFRLTLDFINVYDIRAEAASYAIPRVLRYLLGFQTMMLSVEILYWLCEKKYLAAGALVVIYLFYFSIAAHKSVFFFLLLVLAGWLLYRAWMLRWFALLLVLVNVLSLAEYALHKSFYIMTLFIRRMMYVPVELSGRYQCYFSENPILFFRGGILRRLGCESPSSLDLAHLSGEYGGAADCAANNGLLGDLFASFPAPVGLLVMPLLLVLCFRLLDACAAHKPERLYVLFALNFAVTFINSSWSTVLLTHGFLLACMLLYFFPQKTCQPDKSC